jgi:hypothetical protein
MKLLIAWIAVLSSGGALAQSLFPGEPGELVRPLTSDAAVLDLQEPRNDLPCWVTAVKPELGFDFLFDSGYQVTVALKDLAGGANMLTIVLRVRSERRKDEPVYFVQKIRVPAIEDGLRGNTALDGVFRLGEGKYHVDWLMRDQEERVCARFWDVEAEVDGKDILLAQVLAKDSIEPAEPTPFHDKATVERHSAESPLHVKVIVNFAPHSFTRNALGRNDLEGLVAILREIGHEPRIGSLSIVACSVRTQQVIYRQRNVSRIDLPALGQALKSLRLAAVDAKQLAQKNGESEFLSRLLTEETVEDRPDALIFVSPKYPLDSKIPREIIEQLRGFDHSIFYLNYNPNPAYYPWGDSIGHVVKQLHGLEYTISRPRDLFTAWSDIVSRLVKPNPLPANASAWR